MEAHAQRGASSALMTQNLIACKISLLCTLCIMLSHTHVTCFFPVDRSYKEEDKEAHPSNQDHCRCGTYQPEDCQVAVRVREISRIQDGSSGRY